MSQNISMAGLTELPLANINRAADSENYEVTVPDTGAKEKINITDILALIPLSKRTGDYDYILASIASEEIPDKTQSVTASRSRSILKQHRISQLPEEFSKLVINRASSSFFGPSHKGEDATELSIIVSIKAGTCQAEDFFHNVVVELLELLGITKDQYTVYLTDSEKWIANFASENLCEKANRGVSQSILLLSGDGGIVDVLNGLYAYPQAATYVKPRIGLLVLGTGNAMANSAGLNTGSTKGLPAILHGSPHGIPTFTCTCSPDSVLLVDEARTTEDLPTNDDGCGILHGAVVASWCLHATLVADSDTTEYRKFGSERFSMVANQLLSPSDGSPAHEWKGKITIYEKSSSGVVESRVWERKEHMYILATLVSNLEAALTISPESKPLDGKLRLVDFPPLPSVDVKTIFGMAFSGGKHIEHDAVGYILVEGLKVDFEESDPKWRRICIDGKIIRIPKDGWVEIRLDSKSIADLMLPC